MTEKLERLIKSELECIVKDAQKILSAGVDLRTINYEISLIQDHLSVIQSEIEYENNQVSVSPDSI